MDICIEKRSLFSEEEIINNINRNNTLYRSGKVSKSKKRIKRKRKRNKKRKKWPMLILILFFIFVYGTVTNIRNSNNLHEEITSNIAEKSDEDTFSKVTAYLSDNISNKITLNYVCRDNIILDYQWKVIIYLELRPISLGVERKSTLPQMSIKIIMKKLILESITLGKTV